MRIPWCIATVLLLLAMAVSAQANEVATDPAGDMQIEATGAGSQPFTAEHYRQLDLVGLSATETESNVDMVLALAEAPDTAIYIHEDAQYNIDFRHAEQRFRVSVNMAFGDQVYTWGILHAYSEDDGSFAFIRFFEVARDSASATLSWSLLREDLIDTNGAAPFPGRALEDFHITSNLRQLIGGFSLDGSPPPKVDIHDAMPDEGFSPNRLEFKLGLQQSGHAVLWSEAPMRASNGEASTFVFTLQGRNFGTDTENFRIETMGVPKEWEVTLPQTLVAIGPGDVAEIPVVVSTPFAHQHGLLKSFHVHMTSQSDSNSVGRAEIGIRYHEVPQPAGHHDSVFFHSVRFGEENPFFVISDNLFSGNSGFPSFNTLEKDPNDQAVPIRGNYRGYNSDFATGGAPAGSRWAWSVWLSPDLDMGLDFDLSRNGTLTFPISADYAIAQGVVSAQLLHFGFNETVNDWEATILADMGSAAPFDLAAGDTKTLDFIIEPTPESDLIPYQKRAAMAFFITLDSPRPAAFDGAEAPMLMPGGFAQLPLLEYRDPVQDQFVPIGDLHIAVPAAHPLNPGATRVWSAELHNQGDAAIKYALRLEGVNSEWAELVTPPVGTIGPGGTAGITLIIEAPTDASSGDAADLVVIAADMENPNSQAIGRFLVQIDTNAEHPDDSAMAEELRGATQEDTPPAPLAFVMVGLLVVAAGAMRRR